MCLLKLQLHGLKIALNRVVCGGISFNRVVIPVARATFMIEN